MRSGNWFATYTGKQFWLTDPHPDDVCIEDIAHALSMVCRFGGHTRDFYSVAQHSVHCAQLVQEQCPADHALQLRTLLHDASEAYLGDIVRPLKYSMPDYRALEARTMKVIYQGLKLAPPAAAEEMVIKAADDVMLMAERRDLIKHRNLEWTVKAEPWSKTILPFSPTAAEYQFITRYMSPRLQLDEEVVA